MQSKINEYFGEFGGCFVPEMLHPALKELGAAFLKCKNSKSFHQELNNLYKNYVGRPTPLYFAENLSKKYGAKIFLKNEGQALTGAHKINHCVGQILLAKYMKKKRIIAETGAGQHGLATAAVSAKFGLKCTIYMGEVDYKRQRPNVFWMENLGAEVVPVTEGSRTLKDAVNFALKDFLANSKDSYYLLGSALGPSPYPEIIAYFQKIIGEEVKKQLSDLKIKRPDYIVACVGGGSNAIGIFHEFLNDKKVKLIGVEAGGEDLKAGRHAARFQGEKRVGIFHGYKSYFLQTKEGQLRNTHSISAGLDYPGVSPIHANLYLKKRVFYSFATDKEAISAFQVLARNEGIIPALESAHALAYALKLAKKVSKEKIIVVNISGRGDKDLFILQDYLKDKKFKEFLKEMSV